MKSEINYFYKLYPDVIYNEKNYFYFYVGNMKYYLVSPTKTNREVDLTLSIYNEYREKNILIDEIVININGSFISNINGDNYLLIKSNERDDIKNIYFINEFDKVIKTNKKDELGYVTYDILWSKKIDYYEEHVNDIKNDTLKKCFDYYIGIAENAVSYVKNTYIEEKDENLTIAHKVINKELSNLINPFNLIIDYEIRDISSYIKMNFFNNIVNYDEIENLLNKNKYSNFLIRLLYARLLYPDYYFNLIDKDLSGNLSDEEVNNIISKNVNYEEMLIDMHEILNEYGKLPKIEWLYR